MSNLENIIKSEKPVLAEFWAPWCTYCRRIGPVMEQLKKQREDIEIVMVNIDDEPQLAEKYKIELIPTLLVFSGGEHGEALVAPSSKAQIEEFISSQL